MLYGEGQRDMGRFDARHHRRDPPGTSWLYSSGDTNALSSAVGSVLSPKYGDRFPWKVLFDPIGAKHVAFERDGAGTYVGSSYWYATARDAARFGYLYLNDGCWNGQRIEPEGWVSESTSVNPVFLKQRLASDPTDRYGRLWWLNRSVPPLGFPVPYPHVPEDAYFAEGHWGQTISVLPSLDMVIVRFADDRDSSALDFDHFLELAIAVGRAP
jgi:CubicO group peptidase (beta-lactamase class C family)